MRTRSLFTCFGFLFVFACLGLALTTGVYYYLSAQANQLFGPPNPRLGEFDRLLLSAQLILNANQLTQPVDPDGVERPFQVTLGEGASTISRRLDAEGLVRDAGSFVNYLVYTGLDTTLQAGQYNLSPAQTALEIAQALQDATPAEVTLALLAGWRMEEVATAIGPAGLSFSPEAFLAAAAQIPTDHPLSSIIPPGASLEGFLFPTTYEIPRYSTPDEVIRLLLDRSQAELGSALQVGFEARGLDLFSAVTLASIVEREAVVDDEMPLIAGVFINRLQAGMPLQSDPTVQYALGYNPAQETWWTNPLSLQDLQIASPYNTYQVNGLPPGPIASPGALALQAVANPEQNTYLYFRAACDGSGRHLFAQTFEEHQQNACP